MDDSGLREDDAGAALRYTDPVGERRIRSLDERLYIGRRCLGVDPGRRLILDGDAVSRDHCHLVLDPGAGRAVLVDTSTNGTRVNGRLVERTSAVALRDGDRITVGGHELEFISARYRDMPLGDAERTLREIDQSRMVVVCGDLVDYTALTELHGGAAVFRAMHAVFDDLRTLLAVHRGTLYDYVGDAFLAIWEEARHPDAAAQAVAFALEATTSLTALAGTLPLRSPDGSGLRMGWAVTVGDVAISAYAGNLAGLTGDAVNLGFRLASLAGRSGQGSVIVTEEVGQALSAHATVALGPAATLQVKGRVQPAVVRVVTAVSTLG